MWTFGAMYTFYKQIIIVIVINWFMVYVLATKHLHEYLAIAQSLGDRQQQMQAHARLADAYFKMNDRISNGNKKAIDHLKVTYNLAVEVNRKF